MKIKNIKFFLASVLVFAVIGTFRSCQDYKVRHESKIGDINQSIEEVNFEDIFTPVEESIGIEEKPEIIPSKSK